MKNILFQCKLNFPYITLITKLLRYLFVHLFAKFIKVVKSGISNFAKISKSFNWKLLETIIHFIIISCFNWHNSFSRPGNVYMFLNHAGLFHRGISQSGNFYNPWTLTSPGFAKMKAITLGKHLGCNSKDSKEFIECLRTKRAEDIIGTDHLFTVIKFSRC